MLPVILGMVAGASVLPAGASPEPVSCLHFPDRVHAFVWRNWELVATERLASVLGAQPADVVRMGDAMGLSPPPRITEDQQRRSHITIIRRNWHLLAYDQLLQVLGWTEEQLAYTLREDDFLFAKLGGMKPACEPLKYVPPDGQMMAREREIARVVRDEFPDGVGTTKEPLFDFVARLSQAPVEAGESPSASAFSPRFCSSYFALYGDPLLDVSLDAYPDGYLARLAASGVDGVWLQAVLYKLAPFPWDERLSEGHGKRLGNLRDLIQRARKHGIGVYLYLNEPRAMPLAFFDRHPELKGVTEGDHAALCTSVPDVQRYITESVASVCKAAPALAAFFTITASENFTSCWSHGAGAGCPGCGKRGPAEVIAEVNRLIQEGIRASGAHTRLIAWDWGWSDDWAVAAIDALPSEVAFMSVSEWNTPIRRGGVDSIVGEYSISAVGPGPRAQRHWEAARKRGLKTIAKIQAGNTWELSAVPYIPAVENVARHAANLRDAHVDGLMLGWTLGGYPSPNLEVVAEFARAGSSPLSVDDAMQNVARRRFGADTAPSMVEAWKRYSAAFSEFPYNIGVVYTAPLQVGPANTLWEKPTGYRATMVGFPYDDLDAWRAVYPPEVFAAQFTKIADGFEQAIAAVKASLPSRETSPASPESRAVAEELQIAEAAALHFRSVANQTRFILARRALESAASVEAAQPALDALESVLREEIALARRLYAIQIRDSRIGFEASNQYYYVPMDLAEKVLNCRDLLDRWLPEQRTRLRR